VRRPGPLWTWLLAVVLLVALTALLPYLFAAWRWRAELEEWAKLGLPLEDVATDFPRTFDSPAATRIRTLARSIGIETLHMGKDEDARIEDAREHARRLASVDDDTAVPTTPPTVVSYLEKHEAAMSEIEGILLAPEALVWAENVHEGMNDAPTIGRGFLDLVGLLSLRALEAVREDRAQAQRSVEAAERLLQSVTARATTLDRYIGMVASSQHHATLRLLRQGGVGPDRLRRDFLEGMVRAWQVEAHYYWLLSRNREGVRGYTGKRPQRSPTGVMIRFVSGLYLDVITANNSARIRGFLEQVREEDVCTFDPDEADEADKGPLDRLNVLRNATHGLSRGWVMARETMLDQELTRLVGVARERRAATGAWGLDGSIPSEVCPKTARWTIAHREGGALSISLEADPMPYTRERPRRFVVNPLGSGTEDPHRRKVVPVP
jgi:hypothetical protein